MNRITRAAEVLGVPRPKKIRELLTKLAILTLAASNLFTAGFASANTLAKASVALSDPRPSVASNYTFTGGFTGGLVSASAVKCVMVTVSTATGGTVAPTGYDGTAATVNAASSTLINSSATGWTLAASNGAGSAAGQDNVYKYTNSTGVTPSTTSGATFELDGITNSSTADTKYWFTLATFGSTDCATTPLDNAAPLFINTNGSTLSLTVDQTLSFTVNSVGSATACDGGTTTAASTATTIPFGTVSAGSNSIVCQDLTAASNSTNGYTIYSRYTAKPTNALAQTIADVPNSGTNASPQPFTAAGTEGYGYTTNDATLGTGTVDRFTNPSQEWAAMTTSNAEVAYEAAGVTSTTYRIGHQVGISLTTAPGTYTTTIIYTCTPVY